jgi:hypothetical protein
MQVEPGVGGKPGLDRRGLVGGVVIADQVQVEVFGVLASMVVRKRRTSW